MLVRPGRCVPADAPDCVLQAVGVAKSLRTANAGRLASEPHMIAAAIGKAVRSAKPRTRYAVGGGAGLILLLKRVLSDRGFDRFIARTLR